MRLIAFFFVVLLPLFLCAQQKESVTDPPVRRDSTSQPNALTWRVIMAQCPAHIPPSQWKEMMLQPVNASVYPIRITQALLDTIDATQLDLRYQYIMVEER